MNRKEKNSKSSKNKSGNSFFTGGFIVLAAVMLMTIFLIATQPVYYQRSILLVGLGLSLLIIMSLIFALLQRPVVPGDQQKKPQSTDNMSIEAAETKTDDVYIEESKPS